jgi:nickel-type superoxide dismutase maturation protease
LPGFILRVLAALSPVWRFRIDGPSMAPEYESDDRVLVNRLAYVMRAPRAGDAVVLRDPEHTDRLLLKRIDAVLDEGPGPRRYFVLGDNFTESRDSRHFGPVMRDRIVGKAWLTY